MNSPTRSGGKIGAGRSIVNRNERKFPRGSLMFIQGEQSSEMFILRSGKVRILRQEGENAVELAVLGPGSVLGELSLLDRQPRGATGQVIEEVTVTVVDEKTLNATLRTVPPWLANIIHVVVSRLRDTMARTDRDIVEKSVSCALRILTVMYENEGYESEGEKRIAAEPVKAAMNAIIGIGDMECENVFLHLILKNMLFIRKDEMGMEYLVIKNLEALKLYMNYLRTKQRGASMLGEKFSKETAEIIPYILSAGAEKGRKVKNNVYKIGLQPIGVAMGRDGKSTDVSLDALDELAEAKAIVREQTSTTSTHGTHSYDAIVYNEDTLKRIGILVEWLPVFKEDVLL